MQKATGKGVEVIIKGNPYILHPILMDDIWEFGAYVKSQRIKLLNSVEDTKLRQKMIFEVLDKDFTGKELDKEMKKPKGIMFLLWKALRNDMTLKQVNELIDADNLDEVLNIVSGLYGVAEKK